MAVNHRTVIRGFVIAILCIGAATCGGVKSAVSPETALMADVRVSGLLIEGGNGPIVGARVRSSKNNQWIAEAVTDATGTARLSTVSGQQTIRANAFGFADATASVDFQPPAGSLAMTLEPANDVEVTSVYVDGQGAISKGGTIIYPATVRWRGRLRVIRGPIHADYRLSVLTVLFGGDFPSRLGGGGSFSGPTTSATWESYVPNFMPCSHPGGALGDCYTHSEWIQTNMSYCPTTGGGCENSLVEPSVDQQYPLNFVKR